MNMNTIKKTILSILAAVMLLVVAPLGVVAEGDITGTSGNLTEKGTFTIGEDVVTSVEAQISAGQFEVSAEFDNNGKWVTLKLNEDYTIPTTFSYKKINDATRGSEDVDSSTINTTYGVYSVEIPGAGSYANRNFSVFFYVYGSNTLNNCYSQDLTYNVGDYAKFISDLENNTLKWYKDSDSSEVNLVYGQDYVVSYYETLTKTSDTTWRVNEVIDDGQTAFNAGGSIMVIFNGIGDYYGNGYLTINLISTDNTTSDTSSTTTSDWVPSYKVILRDPSGNIISEQWVAEGQPATIPSGYTYNLPELNWVYRDVDVTAISGASIKSYTLVNTADKG